MEAWKLGGAPEVEARAAASGDDVAERCAAKHAAKGTADLADLLQIKGVLAHVGRTMEV